MNMPFCCHFFMFLCCCCCCCCCFVCFVLNINMYVNNFDFISISLPLGGRGCFIFHSSQQQPSAVRSPRSTTACLPFNIRLTVIAKLWHWTPHALIHQLESFPCFAGGMLAWRRKSCWRGRFIISRPSFGFGTASMWSKFPSGASPGTWHQGFIHLHTKSFP